MKPRYKLDKRQKEIARKQKQDRKKEEKLLRAREPGDAPGDVLAHAPGDADADADADTDVETPDSPGGDGEASGN